MGKNGNGLINSDGKKFVAGTGIAIDQGDRNEIGGLGRAGNLIAGDIGLLLTGSHTLTETKIVGNRIGLDAEGATVVGGEIGFVQ